MLAVKIDQHPSHQTDLRDQHQFGGEFLVGVYSEWALEVKGELKDLGNERRLELN